MYWLNYLNKSDKIPCKVSSGSQGSDLTLVAMATFVATIDLKYEKKTL